MADLTYCQYCHQITHFTLNWNPENGDIWVCNPCFNMFLSEKIKKRQAKKEEPKVEEVPTGRFVDLS